MLKHLRILMSILSFMAFTTDPDGDQKDPPADDQDPKDPPAPPKKDELPADKSTWTVDQWETHTQRIAAKEKAEGKRIADKVHKDEQDELQRKADLAKAESEGEYETAKQKLTSDLETAQSARDQALDLLKATVDAQWDELPEAVRDTFKGEADDVLAKSAFVQQMKPIIDELNKGKETKQPPRGNGGNPPPGTPDPEKTPSALTRQTAF